VSIRGFSIKPPAQTMNQVIHSLTVASDKIQQSLDLGVISYYLSVVTYINDVIRIKTIKESRNTTLSARTRPGSDEYDFNNENGEGNL
jgi:hypothetical protein